ncbi:hypothetical protein A2531_02745 [Candidatus Falkowbacteria bacterium RIFOXYD2_FULL_34_120]|uniref:O-antigen ligase-related domain-containing protein n=1 Tax=Candidatus Falkowbacteria bacterium RIFOXYD2_FULL_34_120 TaxID=1798007 RepID=A0A1F5TSN0_9BACT|nr:MAG: hypothetical protein A2466_03030 [Candidatus Falkowbacteria bacterium RIFOXYC2_FULL_34_220]OGF39437.1 MAG: hypothetical protein A2515_03860 [Candidatus Falkowbacteria bacterium RIFOXYD12_FULL_34_57]OGF41581.1 MAG: hypothetical protein A2531_02745 [Candidatus Falkowbacteria bacterium RIFOXYD2_FULL_34_120]
MLNLYKTIKYGLCLLVFLLPLQTRYFLREFTLGEWSYEYGNISVYATDVLLILLILFFLILKIKTLKDSELIQNSKFKIQNLKNTWFIIAILEFSIFISIFVSIDKWAAIYGYLRFLLGLGLFSLIIYASYNKSKLIWSFVGGVLVQTGLGIWQFLSQTTFASKWLGMAIHNGGDLGASIIETLNGERWLRAYGGLDHPNILGGFLVVAILLLIGLYLRKAGEQDDQITNYKLQITNKFKIQNSLQFGGQAKFKILAFYLVSCIFLMALFFTFSRTAWAGLIVGLIVMLIGYFLKFSLKKRGGIFNSRGLMSILKIITIFAFLGIILSIVFSNLLLTRLSTDTRAEIMSVNERMSMYEISKRVIKDNWLFGTGINNYGITAEKEIRQNAPYYFYQPVHNVFLLIWAEVGIIGLFAFIFLIFNTIYLILQKLRSKDYRKKQSIIYNLSILISVSLMFLLDHWWWSLHCGVFLFWFVLGVCIPKED